MSKRIPYPLGPLESEAMTMEERVLFAWDVGVCEVVLSVTQRLFTTRFLD